ncbi:AraC family transcriptional regulator [Xanthocytophaga agilis]|uniref:AraC family transcriptional regulator n=1 Tax=Xanthocytophaga agilis TaxID=3048010 RepID=A0AAE3RCG1_9BACT|nr:AraC family transcriptional regulator [Xanthocytophaga agilis]MDJ1505855.1 AraC family transcriptional regulator [Xanthocytophaga agilis]
MIFRKHIPTYPLSQYIEHIIYANGPQHFPYLMELPDGRINLVIELRVHTTNTLFTATSFTKANTVEPSFTGEHTMKHGWISGANAKAIVYKNNTDSAILSIRFAVGGFYALTKIPMSEIIHPGLEIELLLGSSFSRLYQRLVNETDINQNFQHIESYFQNYIQNNSFESSVVKFIHTNIHQPIDWLVSRSGYSQKHLIHMVKKETGFSPKYLQRLQRFQNVLGSLRQANGQVNWASVAYEHAYFDQSHFIKEFIHFTGLSPLEYLNRSVASEHNKLLTDIQLF